MAEPEKPKDAEPEKPKGMRVRALAKGYYAGVLWERGEILTIAADGELGTWMDPVDEADRKRLAAVLSKVKRIAPPPNVNIKPTPVFKPVKNRGE